MLNLFYKTFELIFGNTLTLILLKESLRSIDKTAKDSYHADLAFHRWCTLAEETQKTTKRRNILLFLQHEVLACGKIVLILQRMLHKIASRKESWCRRKDLFWKSFCFTLKIVFFLRIEKTSSPLPKSTIIKQSYPLFVVRSWCPVLKLNSLISFPLSVSVFLFLRCLLCRDSRPR